MRTALLILLVTAPALAGQTVWKWVDEQGVTHYSDRSVPGAIKMELGSGNRWNPDHAPQATHAPQPPAASDDLPYQSLEILQPTDRETLVNTAGQVTVNVHLEPALQVGHTLNLYLDGKRVEGFGPDAVTYELTDVPRGLHSLIATVNDRDGERIQQSALVTFTVRQESIAQPPVGPTLRPPPKSKPRGANKLPQSQPSYAALHGAMPPIDLRTNAPVVTRPRKPPATPQGG